jgi:hypothetical protein
VISRDLPRVAGEDVSGVPDGLDLFAEWFDLAAQVADVNVERAIVSGEPSFEDG